MKFTTAILALGACAIPSVYAAPLNNLPTFINTLTTLALSMDNMCDPASVTQPAAAGTPLPTPTGKLAFIAIGKGTQNYTCPSPAVPTATPVALGAIATLYNASCMATHSSSEQMAAMTEGVYKMPADSPMLDALPVAGHHYFFDGTTPAFDLSNLGLVHSKKNASTAAPASATNAVAWLKLNSLPATTFETDSKVSEIYRLETNQGGAPATCGNQEGNFEVPYSAEYWFYTSP